MNSQTAVRHGLFHQVGLAARVLKRRLRALCGCLDTLPGDGDVFLRLLHRHHPDGDGVDLIRDLRTWSAMPIIVLSARSAEASKIAALDAGADDYLVKPVRKAVLLARIEAVMRRVQRGTGPVARPPVVAGPVTIDLDRHEVTVAGQAQALTKTEYQILATLAARQGEAVSREEVMLECWGTAVVGRSRSLDFLVGQIRSKLAGIPLHTVRGFGYRLDH